MERRLVYNRYGEHTAEEDYEKIFAALFCALLSLVLVAAVSTAIAVPVVIRSRGDLSDYMVSEEFQESIGKANAKRAKDASARIMSANLLVHYESWGGTDAHKRAKMFCRCWTPTGRMWWPCRR